MTKAAEAEPLIASYEQEDPHAVYRRKYRKNSLRVLAIFWFFAGVEYVVVLPSAWRYLQHLGATDRIWLSISISSFSVAQFLFSPVYGRFADKFSTKYILLISNLFEMVGNALYLFAQDTYSSVESRFICGMGAAAGSVIFAFIARTASSPLELNKDMGLVMTSRGVGLIMGPAFNFLLVKINVKLGSFHLNELNSPGLIMFVIWTLCQFAIIFYFVDPPPITESHGRAAAKPTAAASSNSNSNSNGNGTTSKYGGVDGANGKAQQEAQAPEAAAATEPAKSGLRDFLGLGVVALLLVQFINMFNQTAYETFVTPFTQEVFDFNQVSNSMVYMITAVVAIAIYYVLVFVQKRYRPTDRATITLGIALQVISFIIFWQAPSTSLKDLYKFALASVVFTVALPLIYIAPALQAKLTDRRYQGLGQGILRSVQSLAQIIGPVWATTAVHPVLFWAGMLGFTALSLVILVAGWKQLLPKVHPNASQLEPTLLPPGEGILEVVAINSESASLVGAVAGADGQVRSRAASRVIIN